MEFCPKCGSVLFSDENNALNCSCGYFTYLDNDREYNIKEKISEKSANIAVDGNEYESIDLLYPKDVHLKSYDWRREDWG